MMLFHTALIKTHLRERVWILVGWIGVVVHWVVGVDPAEEDKESRRDFCYLCGKVLPQPYISGIPVITLSWGCLARIVLKIPR